MDRLNPTVLISRLPSLLPEANKKLDCDEAGLAALLHTAMAELDFILIALDEHDSPTTGLNNVLPKDWAQNGPSQYTFCYKHKLQSDSKYLLKVIKLGDQTSCKAIDVENPESELLSLNISTFPLKIVSTPPADGFTSSDAIEALMTQFFSEVVSPILPVLREVGDFERPETPSASEPADGAHPPPSYEESNADVVPENPPRAPENPQSSASGLLGHLLSWKNFFGSSIYNRPPIDRNSLLIHDGSSPTRAYVHGRHSSGGIDDTPEYVIH